MTDRTNDDLNMLYWLRDQLAAFDDSNKVHEFPPEENDPTEPGDWVIDAGVEFDDHENNRVETWTFTILWWAGPAATEKDMKYKRCWQMRKRAMQFFGDRRNWGFGGHVNVSKMNPEPEGHKGIGPYFHGEAIWIALCFEITAVRYVRHGD